jgi:hypothetical protein
MPTYLDQVKSEKTFIANAIIKIGTNYFSIRNPDSGLSVPAAFNGTVLSLSLNSSSIDIRKVNTTIAGYSFRLLDKDFAISNLINGNAASLIGQDVTIWLGRNRKRAADEACDFSGYYQLPITKLRKLEHADNSYVISTSEDTSRIDRPIYDASSALSIDILAGTTTIIMRDSIAEFPAAGFVRVDKEVFSYTSKNDSTKTFSGVIRGEYGTTPDAHSANTLCYQAEKIVDNPLNIILKLLISNGGGGAYDVLSDGLGISPSLIDVSGIETIRDSLFSTVQIELLFYDVQSVLKLIETEILQPLNLRFSYGLNSKLGLVVLDKAVFTPIIDAVNENTMLTYPKWSVDDTKIINRLKIEWDYSEADGKFLKYSEYTDAASVTTYGEKTPLKFQFKGLKTALGGASIIDDFARVLFARFSIPIAEVEVKTQIDKSLKNIGDKVFVESSKIPSPMGGLVFESDMEITKRAINYQTNEVTFTFAFTSFTKIRSAYISPSDLIKYVGSQKLIGVANGRAEKYKVGMFMRLWNEAAQAYEADAPNEIAAFILGQNNILDESGFTILDESGAELIYEDAPNDLIVFKNNWTTTLTLNHRIRFANYSEVVNIQKRFSFISNNGANFSDGKQTYKVTY